MTLTRDQIIGCADLTYSFVNVWGGQVRIRTLTAGEAAEYLNTLRKATAGGKDIGDFRSLKEKLVALCIVDNEGARLFPEPEDVALLVGKSSKSIDTVWQACMDLNGMGAEHEDLVGK